VPVAYLFSGMGILELSREALVGTKKLSQQGCAFWHPWSSRDPGACMCSGADFPDTSENGVVGCGARGSMGLFVSLQGERIRSADLRAIFPPH
jgi:hypothetical protein